jgi:excisionase family DNA binding protein
MDQLLYTVAQCCRMAAIGRTKFYELVASGEIPVRKVGKRTLVAASDLRDWVQRLPTLEAKVEPVLTGGKQRKRSSHGEARRTANAETA